LVENLSNWNVTKSKQEWKPVYSMLGWERYVSFVASEGRRDYASVAKVAETYFVFKQQIHDTHLSCERNKKYYVVVNNIARNTTEPRRPKKQL
jgi:hypothetical protein